MSQTRLPDWYPDPSDPSVMRWWDGMAWTDITRTGEQRAEPMPIVTQPRVIDTWRASHAPLIAGLCFLISGVLAGTQMLYMTTAYSAVSFRLSRWGVPVSLPFDWYLVLFPYWIDARAYFTWGLAAPVILLLACSLFALVLRRRPRQAMLVIAGCLTIENLLLLIPIFIDSGTPGYTLPIFMPSNFSEPRVAAILMGVLIVHVLVWALPLLFAGTATGTVRTRRRMSLVFLVACVVYFLWYLGSFLFAGVSWIYLLTPGPTWYTGSWIAPVSTLLCLASMLAYVLPSVRPRQE